MRYHRFEKLPFKISHTLIVRSINMRDYVMLLVGDWNQQSKYYFGNKKQRRWL